MNDVEKDVRIALENASMEYISEIMEDVDPDAFVLPKEISTKRIKERVMNRIESKKGTNKVVSFARVAAASAAAAVVLMGGAMVISEPVRAAVFEMFSYVPGKGIVETQKMPMAAGTEGSVEIGVQPTSDYYILANEGRVTTSENLNIRLNNVAANGNILEISYSVKLNKISFAAESQVNDKFNHLEDYEGEEYRKIFADYYSKMGYDSYFEISAEEEANFCALKSVKSSMTMNGAVLQKLSSEILDSEAGMGDFFEIVEKYDITGMDLENVTECSLSISDVEAAITLEKAKAYETKEEAMEELITVKGDRVAESIVCKPTVKEGLLSLELYFNNIGDNEIVTECYPVIMADGEEIYSDWPVSLGDNAVRREYDLTEVPGANDYSIVIDSAVVKHVGDAFTLDMSDHQYGTKKVDMTYETGLGTLRLTEYKVMTFDELMEEMCLEDSERDSFVHGDYVWVNIDIDALSENVLLDSFENYYLYQGEKHESGLIGFIDEDNFRLFIPLGTTIDKVDSLVISNTYFSCETDIQIPVNK